MNLWICTRNPDLSRVDESLIKDSHILYLRERLAFRNNNRHWKKASVYSDYISKSDYIEARYFIQELWRNIVSNEQRTDLSHYEYHFCNCYTAVYFWEAALRRAILAEQPKTIWISESIARSGKLMLPEDHVACLSSFDEWMLNRSILKIIREFKAEVRSVPDIQYQNEEKKGNILTYLRLPSLLAVERALRVSLRLRVKGISKKGESAKALVIAQKSKTLRLEEALWREGIKYSLHSYASAEKCILQLSHNPKFCFVCQYDMTSSALDILTRWITEVSVYHDKVIDPNIENFLKSNKIRVVLTDGDNMPLVRRLNKYIMNQEEYTIFTIPEGGIDMDRQPSNETFRLKSHPNLIKCVLSEESANRLKRKKINAKEIIVMGYDTSLLLAKIIAHPIRLALKSTIRHKYKGIIFYDYPFFANQELGIMRTTIWPEIEALRMTDQIIKKLALADYLVISHTRFMNVYSKYFPRLFAHFGFHWSLLARVADVVVSTNSSIVSECLSIKTPVLLWQPESKAPKAFSYLTHTVPPIRSMRSVSKLSEVELAISELMKVSKDDFLSSKYYAPIPNHRLTARKVKLLLSEVDPTKRCRTDSF